MLLRNQVKAASLDSTVDFIPMDDCFKDSLEIRDISTACYYRLLIPWLLPDYEKVIYSDVDIIFNDDLGDLYDTDMGDCYVAGVNTPGFASKKRYSRHIVSLGLDPDKYINSGFLLINAKLQREKALKDSYLGLSEKKFLFQDQDIINIVCKDKILFLEKRYNTIPENIKPRESFIGKEHKEGENSDSETLAVVHYTGPKPWKTFTFGWLEWWDIYRESIFFDYSFYLRVSRYALDKRRMIRNQIRLGVERLIKLR